MTVRNPRVGRPPPEHTPAVVLWKTLRGDSDYTIVFLTRERGLVTAVAKNAKQSVRRFGGGMLTPGTAAWFDFRFKPGMSVNFVERGEHNPKAPVLPLDPIARTLAAWALELVRAFEAADNPAKPSFDLLLRHLAALTNISDYQAPALRARIVSLAFTKRYLELAGFGPSLQGCRKCGQTKAPSWHLDITARGLLCPQCGQLTGKRTEPISESLIASLNNLSPLPEPLNWPEDFIILAESFFQRAASIEAGRSFNSPRVLRELLGQSQTPFKPKTTFKPGPKKPPSHISFERQPSVEHAPMAPPGDFPREAGLNFQHMGTSRPNNHIKEPPPWLIEEEQNSEPDIWETDDSQDDQPKNPEDTN
ncbi:MAG: DNA repair protein RecO C-terminal domain-containing protein [Deltaproteobacteria bacterium]|jgi:DNA repair protein RecO (recombination protein O)|nr:DNA repair protein RecO C-terminal domain-containing protein [Deltaproteobacteria bacterium]